MNQWIEDIVERLTLRRKIAQLISSRVLSYYVSSDSDEYQNAVRLVSELGIGGITFFQGNVTGQVLYTNLLQAEAEIPLLVAQDAENGIGMRLPDATVLPHMMAVGASGKSANAYDATSLIAAEANAMGVHHVFAPVADVNNNPANPIINIRSFGARVEEVSEFVTSAVRGLQDNRVIATAKHFPGHGDTAVDTHLSLAVLPFGRKRLDELELVPFRAAIKEGVRSIMVGHLSVPELDPSGLPASLSREVVTGLLRDEMGFDGLVVTDALDMQAITNTYGAGEAAVLAIEAGVDMLLLVSDEHEAVDAIEHAVKSGRVSQETIDSALRRVLTEKVWCGITTPPIISMESVSNTVASRKHLETSRRIALDAMCRADSIEGPIRTQSNNTLVIPFVDDACHGYGQVLQSELAKSVSGLQTTPGISVDNIDVRREGVLDSARDADSIVVAVFLRVRSYSGSITLSQDIVSMIKEIIESTSNCTLISFGSPYLLEAVEHEGIAKLATFSTAPASEWAAAQILLGRAECNGVSPV